MDQTHFNHDAAPLRIGQVTLRARDARRLGAFYSQALGLALRAESADRVVLGTAERALVTILLVPTATPRNRAEAGLFHTAFLLPRRADLAHWLAHALDLGLKLEGASDHAVSEAIYFSDPEGNGIEIYTDRPTADWHSGGRLRMTTQPLDGQDLLRARTGTWTGFPPDAMIGHVHLQVGDTATAEGFYRDILGFDLSTRYPGASFFGSGGYHHHLAANVWNSRRAGARTAGATGLVSVEVIATPQAREGIVARLAAAGLATDSTDGALWVSDPWGTGIALAA